jgi:hypothetical protein
MEQKLRFGLVLGRLAILKKIGPISSNFCLSWVFKNLQVCPAVVWQLSVDFSMSVLGKNIAVLSVRKQLM